MGSTRTRIGIHVLRGRWRSCFFPHYIVHIYTIDPEVMRIGATLLVVAAVFQIFDGIQIVASGALRGAGETRFPCLPTASPIG